MFCNGKSRFQICQFIRTGAVLWDSVEKCSCIDSDSHGTVYLLTCKKCEKQYVGDTITSFRNRCKNHKNSLSGFGKGQRGICGDNCTHIFCRWTFPFDRYIRTIYRLYGHERSYSKRRFWIYKLVFLLWDLLVWTFECKSTHVL